MNQFTAEIIILVINALGAGILLFIAGVIQRIMNEMDELAFKRFLNVLDRTAMTNPFLVTIETLPTIAAVFYFIVFGFNHWWYTGGFATWIIGGSIAKIGNMPIYKWVGNPNNNDPEELRKQRHKLEVTNNLRAWITLASVLLMTCQFGIREAVIVVTVSVVITYPLLWIARKYISN